MRWAGLALSVVAGVMLAGCTVIGVREGTEQPAYDVVAMLADDVELRRYGSLLAVETAVPAGPDARDRAFRRLAGYIFGGNTADRKIAMTAPVATAAAPAADAPALPAPVATAAEDGALIMRFFLPAEITRDTAPEPADAAVRLVDVPARTLAVLRFSGRPEDRLVAERTDALLATLADAGIEPAGSPLAFFYDPPWTVPALRRNEVAVPVERTAVARNQPAALR